MKKYTLITGLVLLMSIAIMPQYAHAASLSFETIKKDIAAGDTFIITAKIDTQNTTINTVEGDIVLSTVGAPFVINDFTLSNSAFTLWPRTPSLSKDGTTISFVGGVPGGLRADNATLFSIVVETSHEGDITITPKNIAVFANNGSGTRTPLVTSATTIHIDPKSEASAVDNEWQTLVRADKKAPKPFTIVLGREPSLFDGKRFVFFTATDAQSGISYYEVSENGKPAIRSGSMYVLENQDDASTPVLTVTAYDKAGNATVSTYSQPRTKVFGVPLIVVISILVIAGLLLYKRKLKKRSKNAHMAY